MWQIAYENTETRAQERASVEEFGRALMVLAAGALLGLAVALPYDQLLGLPDSTGAILGSVVWVTLLGTRQLGGVAGAAEWDNLPERTGAHFTLPNGYPIV
jgi:hypothetical protein